MTGWVGVGVRACVRARARVCVWVSAHVCMCANTCTHAHIKEGGQHGQRLITGVLHMPGRRPSTQSRYKLESCVCMCVRACVSLCVCVCVNLRLCADVCVCAEGGGLHGGCSRKGKFSTGNVPHPSQKNKGKLRTSEKILSALERKGLQSPKDTQDNKAASHHSGDV